MHHRRGLRRLLRDDVLLARIEQDFESAGLSPRRLAMLRYVERLTRTPTEMQREDVEHLRQEGFADAEVLAICEVAAYYAYANRIADGLGVELEGGLDPEVADGSAQGGPPDDRPRRTE